MIQFHKAERRMSKLRLAIAGPAGSGKTYSALLIAFGLIAEAGGNGNGGARPGKSSKENREAAFHRVAMIDTERGSGELYADLGEYDVCSITPPFEPEKYRTAIKAAEESGYSVIIIDSLSHAWSGEGGLLDMQGRLADRSGNSWAAWRKVTPKHNQLVEAMLQSPCHIIATMRSKMEYSQVTENGKTAVKKLGMNPIQRDGMEYEFTLFLDMDLDHVASSSKDRTSLFDGKFFKPSAETGKILIEWLQEGEARQIQNPQPEMPDQDKRSDAKSENPEVQPTEASRHPETGSETHAPDPETQGNRNLPVPEAEGNGSRILYAKLNSYGLDRDAYRAYCCGKYNIQSMKNLTAAHKEEQIKILNSLQNPERLSEFKKVLDEAQSKINQKQTGGNSTNKGNDPMPSGYGMPAGAIPASGKSVQPKSYNLF